MNIILMGPPGAGKGTQATNIVKEYGLAHISTGDIFRKELGNNTKYGVIAKYFMQFGHLVPDDFTCQMVNDYFENNEFPKGFILDGFPRTIVQARELESMCKAFNFKIDAVINLEVDNEKLLKRLSGRRTCKNCGATYHIIYKPSKVEGVCDVCGGETYQRPDESEEAVKVRLETYDNQTKPLIDYYEMKNQLTRINGDQEMEEVFADIKALLDPLRG